MKIALDGKQNKIFYLVVLAILAVALISRFIFLGDRPVHHDEGMLAYFAYKIVTNHEYSYSPQIHGPILFYLQAIVFKIFSASTTTMRAAPAAFGVILVLLPFAFLRSIGKRRAIFISILILTSPLMLYYARFLVHTALVVVVWFAFIFVLREFLARPRSWSFYLASFLLAFSFGISETTYIFVAAVVSFAPIAALFKRKRFVSLWHSIIKYFKSRPFELLAGFLIFVLTWVAIYSVAFTDVQSLVHSLPNPFDKDSALGFWLSQHSVHLGNQPWFYYLLLFAVYEPVILAGALAGLLNLRRDRSTFYLFVCWLAIAMTVGFSWAGEKFPWLALPPLLSLTILAGWYLGGSWKTFAWPVKIIWVILLAFSLFNAYRLSFVNYADPRELAVYVQTPESFKEVLKEINNDCFFVQKSDCVMIDQKISWPLSWYFYDTSGLFYPEGFSAGDETHFVFVAPENFDKVNPGVGWERRSIQLRDWWMPEVCHHLSCAGKFARYFFSRTIWNDKGGLDVYLYRR